MDNFTKMTSEWKKPMTKNVWQDSGAEESHKPSNGRRNPSRGEDSWMEQSLPMNPEKQLQLPVKYVYIFCFISLYSSKFWTE